MIQNFPIITKLEEWKKLIYHFDRIKDIHLKEYFSEDIKRGKNFSVENEDLYFDFSKNFVNKETIGLLISLADRMELRKKINNMFSGAKINFSEGKAALHTALRNFSDNPVVVDGVDVMPEIIKMRERMKVISERIRSGTWRGFSGKRIKNIINIGIGGSDLGPRFVCNALRWYSDRDINVRFVSNMDGTDLSESLLGLSPEETLFIIASKTFTTSETMTNAKSAKEWLKNSVGNSKFISNHFIAITSNTELASKFGILKGNILKMWDWVGGRYSISSSIGLTIMILIGFDSYILFLKGLYKVDEHFKNSPFNMNIPVLMALLGMWYNNFFNFNSYAVIPYDQYLEDFPVYLQQCDMESNGKSVTIKGERINYHTCPVVWGGVGTNCQHAFFQMLHQGSRIVPVDFIGFANSLNEIGNHHKKLMSNLFAQSKALAFGRTEQELIGTGIKDDQVPFRMSLGNRPSNSFIFKKLSPLTLGMLIALYEHKIFTQGVIWNINSFDQWGVELGKEISNEIFDNLNTADHIRKTDDDSSTSGLINFFISSQNSE